ncbi:MAG: glycosyltransferase family 4 protein [Chloroflexota bacterium]|nr:MAG: glycosyltransferase family 1 protein [Chloroflexota bacterium]
MSINGAKPDKLKILICILYYFPHRTGMQLYIQRVSEALVQRGHEVTILAARHRPDLPAEEMINGVRVVRLWAPPVPISRGMIMPAYPLAAARLIAQHDVVSIHTPMLETALIAVLAGLLGRKVVATHHGDLILPRGVANRVIQTVMFMLYRFMAARAARLIAYSDDYANHSYYLLPYRDKVSVIYPPVHMPQPNPQRAEELRQQWAPEGGPIIGFAGRFVEEKRPDLLIRALDVIGEHYPNARVVFAGEYDIKYENTWERYQGLVRRYRDRLVFLGLLDDMQAMADFFAACDVLALTSDSECFALVQVEAMLCGTPVVMTDTPGGRVPVQVSGMGKLAPPGDYRAIGEAIVEVLKNPEAYRRPREVIESLFSFEETVDRYERYFRENAVTRGG